MVLIINFHKIHYKNCSALLNSFKSVFNLQTDHVILMLLFIRILLIAIVILGIFMMESILYANVE